MSTQRFLISKYDESIVSAFLPEITGNVGGQFVVETPDGVQIDEPLADYNDLKAKKFAGINALYPDFPEVAQDELDDEATINIGHASHRATTGKYDVCLAPSVGGNAGQFRTNAQALGIVPTSVLVLWQVYELTFTANAYGGYDVGYVVVDQDDGDLTVQVSVNGGTSWNTVSYATDTALTHAGSSFVIRFLNNSTTARYIGYYSFHGRN